MAKRTKRRKKPSILLILIAILLPPLAIYLEKGAGKDLLLNLILCLFFWIPGILHALYLISR